MATTLQQPTLAEETYRYLTDAQYRAQPVALYHRLLAEEPVHRSPAGVWLISRHADAEAAMRDDRFSRAASAHEENRFLTDGGTDDRWAGECFNGMMLNSDPPSVTRMRRLARPPFLPKAVERWKEYATGVVESLLDRFELNGEMDAKADFAMTLPQRIICAILGVDFEDHVLWEAWTHDVLSINRATNEGDAVAQGRKSTVAFCRYFETLVDQRRADPRDDLITELLMAREEGASLSTEELIGNLMLLVMAGHETTANLICNGVRLLMENRDHWDRVVADPTLVPTMVEEVLRLQGPIRLLVPRTAVVDVVVGETVIPAGERAIVLTQAANRDPEAFDGPDDIDIGRNPNPHVGFGSGSHFCLGSHLARLQARTVFEALARRFPALHLAVDPAEIALSESLTIHAWQSMPVRAH